MRWYLLPVLLFHFVLRAQPDLSVAFVHAETLRPLRGTYAHHMAAHQWLGSKRRPAWTVELHFTVGPGYPYRPSDIGTHQSWPLVPDTVRGRHRRYPRFGIIVCWCLDQYLLVRRGTECMRIDLPNDAEERAALLRRAREGKGPELFRFRPGRYTYRELADDPACSAREARFGGRWVRT